MKTKIVSVVLAVLLIGLVVLPGCVSRGELNELKAQLVEKDAQIEAQAAQINELGTQIAALNSTIEAKDAKIAELKKENTELKKEIEELKKSAPEVAKIEITLSLNPVLCKDGYWRWRVVLTEVNGVGVKLESLTMYIYYGEKLLDTMSYGSDSIKTWLKEAYLSSYSSASFGAGFPCQSISHQMLVITGTDDNGHKITAEGRVDFIR